MAEQSILDSVKKVLGIAQDYTAFDTDIILNINSCLMILNQLGVGPDTEFSITDSTSTWEDFLGDDLSKLNSVRMYVALKTRLAFDPPTSGFVTTSIQNQLAELEWRLSIKGEELRNA